jgi:hypothetical protein
LFKRSRPHYSTSAICGRSPEKLATGTDVRDLRASYPKVGSDEAWADADGWWLRRRMLQVSGRIPRMCE